MYGLYQINASAGSGKTYTLTERFLTLLAEDNDLESILAITFTNAAAQEMRSRILRAVKEVALGLHPSPLLSQARAITLVNEILYNFSNLNIRTIDSLLLQMVRTAALSLHLHPDFTPVFSTDETLDPYLEILATRARRGDAVLAEGLKALILSLYQEGNARGFLAGTKIERVVKPLFAAILLQECQDIADAKTIKERYEQALASLQDNAHTLLTSTQDLRWQKLAHKAIARLQDKDTSKLDSAFLAKDTVEELFCKGVRVPALCASVYEAIKTAKEHFLLFHKAIKTIPCIDFGKAMVTAFLENDTSAQYLHSEIIPSLVRSIFENALPAEDSFILLVSTIKHILIDEFQDTSDAQWLALNPLVVESLAKGGSFTWVGDIKQSIFSWRGGDPDLFDGIIDPDCSDLPQSVAKDAIHLEQLSENWRSRKTIIDFTNTLFSPLADPAQTSVFVAACMPNDMPASLQQRTVTQLSKAFAHVRQSLPTAHARHDAAQDGCVVLTTSVEEDVIADLANQVHELSTSRPLSDMLILVRKNEQAKEIALALLHKGIPVVTENSLLLSQHALVIESIAFVRYLASKDTLAFWTLIHGSILDITASQKTALHDACITQAIPPDQAFEQLFPNVFERYIAPFAQHATHMSVYDLLSEWYAFMHVEERFPQGSLFVRRLLEIVHEANTENAGSLSAFLEYWENNQDQEKVPMPEQMQAVRIMTIHKAKGLEAPLVLIPWKMPRIMPEKALQIEECDGLRLATFVDKHSPLPYYTRYLRLFCETINLLYVAITRACEALYLFHIPTKMPNKDILLHLLKAAGYTIPSQLGSLAKGTIPRPRKAQPPIPFLFPQNPWRPQSNLPPIKIAADFPEETSAKDVGRLVHDALSVLHYDQDHTSQANNALNFALRAKKYRQVDKATQQTVLRALSWFLSQPESKHWLDTGRRQQKMLDTDGSLIRIDLLVPDSPQWLVIDYRSGSPHPSHAKRLRHICHLLAGQSIPSQGLLVYLDHERFQRVSATSSSSLASCFTDCR
ncbi:MAG: UvrD-helicase domain-containing protein [Desulfovibrio sp.]|nr:UvrD-helicase domain-containing protein [Desulfovibrio sp.]